LAPAIERITRRTGRPPRAVTADRGYGQASVEHHLHQLGVATVPIARTRHRASPDPTILDENPRPTTRQNQT